MIEIGPQQLRVDGWQTTPPLQQRGRRQTTTHERAQLGDRMPIHGDRERLAASDALQHPAAVVAELAHGNVVHHLSVSRVRQTRKTASAEPAFAAREVIAHKDLHTLAHDILALDDDGFRSAFKGIAMKNAKLAGLQRNAWVVLDNADN